jgi:hypothetical protein
MGLLKNPGQLLTSKFRGVLELIPPKFRAKIGIIRKVQQVPLDVEPDTLGGVLVQSQTVQERTDERAKTNVELEGDITTELVSQVRLDNGQIATRTEKLVAEGTDLVVPDGAVSGNQENLGIGFIDQTVIDAPLPGPTIYSTRIAPDGVVIQVARTRKLGANITESESVSAGVWTKVYREGETSAVATEVVETRPVLI